MCYKDSLDSIITLKKGSYFGDISYLFKTLNQFYFENKKDSNGVPATIFCLKDNLINSIMRNYPEMEKVLKIRALRRQHYFKKLQK